MAATSSHTALTIPTVDLAAVDAAQQIRAAYSTYGFAYVVNHGVASERVAELFETSRRFHASEQSQKLEISLDKSHRGFIPINTSTARHSTLAKVTKPNQSQSFMMMREDAADSDQVRGGHYLAGSNKWPEWQPDFRPVVEGYNDQMVDLGMRLVGLIEEALGCRPGELSESFQPPTTWLRLLHYPVRPADAPDDLYGSAPHCDFGFITLLAQDNVGGLQVMSPEGEWLDVPPMDDAFVMNVGDMLHQWSNGLLRSTPHRVINVSGVERYSCPFFFDPHVSTVIAPLSSCVATEGETRFEPINFGEFLRGRLEGSYDQHASASASGET